MSNDLISRSALMRALRGNVLVDVTPNLEQAIEAQPTAFDLDKVLEDLEEYAYSDGLCFRNRGCPYEDDEKIDCGNCAAIGALEIVKGGVQN